MRGFSTRFGVFLLAMWATVSVLTAQNGPVSYVYDELGRLVGVVDGTGASAVYVYDAVGNLLSIQRHAAGAVTIIDFTPNSGAIGSTVTIRGTGFSATPSQNTVTFNGVAATVTSSSSMEIVTNVPAGASSGSIAVTAPAGSATSSSPFTVGASAPTITSFTPQVGPAGTIVTISGTNFQTIAANNRTKFNRTQAIVSSSSSSSISTIVPAQTSSGRITVATPTGLATGADFFIPPSPYAAADVAFTGRATLGQAITPSIGTANKIALVVFDGTVGQRVSVLASGTTIPNWKTLSILKPDGTTLASSTYTGSGTFINTQTLPATGTYTAFLDPDGTGTGSAALTIYDVPADISGPIVPGGAAVPVTLTTPGQNARLTFSGTSGQRVSLYASGITISNWKVLSILKPDGTTLTSATFVTSSRFIDVQTLPVSGTYTVLLDPELQDTGNATLALYDVPADVSGPIVPGGSAVGVTVTTPGQNVRLTFSGTAGQRVSLNASGITISNWKILAILKPDNTTLASESFVSSSRFMDVKTLPSSGTYTVLLDPEQQDSGNATLTAYNVPADVTGTVTIGGAALGVTLGMPGQNAAITFSGTAGQQATVRITGNSIAGVTVKLLKPDGSQLTASWTASTSLNLATQTLPTTGTYRIAIDPDGANTGSLNVNVTSP